MSCLCSPKAKGWGGSRMVVAEIVSSETRDWKEGDPEPCIRHYTKGSRTEAGLYRAIGISAVYNHPLLVRLCYNCKKWFKEHDLFMEHIGEHSGNRNVPSVGLGEWSSKDLIGKKWEDPLALDMVNVMVLE